MRGATGRARGAELAIALARSFALALALALALVATLAIAAAEAGAVDLPYRDFSRSETGFLGPGRDDPPPTGLATVRIGLLAPAQRPEGARMRAGVELALAEANARGGFEGLLYELVFRADDGPWGMGAKQVTALAYEDSVWTIIGGLEGGAAHLAELVAAKLWVPIVTPTAGDLSIDYANVPWVFRCFPSDDRQARRLLEDVRARGTRRLVVYTEAGREGLTGWRRLEEAARELGPPIAARREYRPYHPADAATAGDLEGTDAVVIWGRAGTGGVLLRAIRALGYGGPVFGPAHLLAPELDLGTGGELVIAAALDPRRDDRAMRDFRRRYREAAGVGEEPDAVAVYSYDAARVVLAAIGRAGLNRARIRDEIAAGELDGLSGPIRFDGLGGSSAEPRLVTIGGVTTSR